VEFKSIFCQGIFLAPKKRNGNNVNKELSYYSLIKILGMFKGLHNEA
jgi:hypothetical protein